MRRPSRSSCLQSLLVFMFAVSGCGEDASIPPPKPPDEGVARPVTPPKATLGENTPAEATERVDWYVSTSEDDPRSAKVGGLELPKPVTWIWQPASMRFRTLQYQVPGQGEGSGAAELIFSVFDGDDGGPTDMNIQRWVNQFTGEDGKPSDPVRSVFEGDGYTANLVETAGSYQGMGAPAPRVGQRQLGAIVELPGRRIFIRITGPDVTVEAARSAFEKMITEATVTNS